MGLSQPYFFSASLLKAKCRFCFKMMLSIWLYWQFGVKIFLILQIMVKTAPIYSILTIYLGQLAPVENKNLGGPISTMYFYASLLKAKCRLRFKMMLSIRRRNDMLLHSRIEPQMVVMYYYKHIQSAPNYKIKF